MRFRSILKILVTSAILLSFVVGMTDRRNQVLTLGFTLILAIILIAEYYLFTENVMPKKSDFKLDLGELRKLVDTDGLPVRLNSLIVAEGEIPDWIVVAGGAQKGFPISFTSFQVVYEDKTIIIECPFNRGLYEKSCGYRLLGIKGKRFYEENYEAMQRAMLEAEYIVATHEHWDHGGGIAQSPNVGRLIKKMVLTSEQVHGHTIAKAGFPERVFDDYVPLEYNGYHVLAPGVVLIKAPGHSVGSQIIFVRFRGGVEFLFIGDVAWNMVNVEGLVNHSRMGMLLRYENGSQLGHQIRWLHENIHDNPEEDFHLLTSHDPRQIEEYTRSGLIGATFELSTTVHNSIPNNQAGIRQTIETVSEVSGKR
jgi:glyoxylase-like metal-dependent hydrolase (beta-lactamase superfamily II)